MTALFRCDATAAIGFGHLSRCIALAEALAMLGVRSRFAGKFDPAAAAMIEAAGFDRFDCPSPLSPGQPDDSMLADIESQRPAFVVVDSYGADVAELEQLRATGTPVAVIDDFRALERYPCEAVLNFTWGAAALGYPPGPRLLLGPAYFPARRALVDRRPESIGRARSGPVHNLLVAIGGSDLKRLADRLLRALGHARGALCVQVVGTGGDIASDALAAFAPGSAILPRQPDLSAPLAWAEACLTGGGLIKYESAFMGVPAAAIAQNAGQAAESRTLAADGLVFDLGEADMVDDDALADALAAFLDDGEARGEQARRIRECFPPDPTAHAARAILEAVGLT